MCEFSGLDNINKMINDKVFIEAFKNTMIFLIVQVPIMLFLGLIYAALLNNPKLKFLGLYRTILFLPAVTSLVAYSIVFKLLFANDGIINDFLVNVGILDNPIMWLQDPFYAKVVIIIALIWRWTGYNMIFYLSSMQNIPSEVYEAAKVDGAGAVTTFFKITIPQLKPIIFFTAVMSTIGTLQLFDEAMNITKGGPGYATTTISQYIYNVSFVESIDFGYAAALSYTVVIIVVILSLIQKKVMGE